ncbi:hypothetical protein IFT84_01345 [Rhizobium sp. CFBP 8762]|uniref:hypothetical protein n=1 Tax=Rhizobium sp. CFBP 8762 TaxID=2775279 RepID=UPI00177EB9AB|nr:hypothetical protein [Rhizobium sp. CFBP 8762]MBD8553161.1 hypothetical protein [Rhizobium sp. CFBP 8762]
MDLYVLWKDLLTAYHASSDWIKALWLVIPPTFLLVLIGMIMCYKIASRKPEPTPEPAYPAPAQNNKSPTSPLLEQPPTEPQPWV